MIRVLLLLLVVLPLQAKEKYYLSVCAIFRNEARFLKEWIEYHSMLGVEHFYLFNHLSEDAYEEVLAPYIRKGIIDLFNWPYEASDVKSWDKIQCAAYNRLLLDKGRETFWLAIIDTDEFILPLQTPNIATFLKEYEEYGGIGINWQLYGTSDVYRVQENESLIERLTLRAPTDHPRNRYVKTIFQPKRARCVKKPHHCKYHRDYYHVDENKQAFTKNKSLTDQVSVNKIRINHYTYRDEEFLHGEKFRRLAKWYTGTTPSMDPAFNQVEDTVIGKYVPALKERLFSTK